MNITGKTILTDSLCWLKTIKPLSVYVANRLKEIKSLEETSFTHVSSEDNLVDLSTKRQSSEKLLSSICWHGLVLVKEPCTTMARF